MNKMVFELQPDIIVNNRNKLPGDFSTPEQQIKADTEGRAWESCMTLNDSWGTQGADVNGTSPGRGFKNWFPFPGAEENILLSSAQVAAGSVRKDASRLC